MDFEDRKLILIKSKIETSLFTILEIKNGKRQVIFSKFRFMVCVETCPTQLVCTRQFLFLRFPQIPMYHKLPSNISLYVCLCVIILFLNAKKNAEKSIRSDIEFRALRLARGSLMERRPWDFRKICLLSHSDPFHSAGRERVLAATTPILTNACDKGIGFWRDHSVRTERVERGISEKSRDLPKRPRTKRKKPSNR